MSTVSLSKLLAGRRRESLVWAYFDYSEQTRKSKCQVVDKSGKECGALLAGKNPSNLVNHLLRLHKETHTELQGKEKAREREKCGTKRSNSVSTDGDDSFSSPPPLKSQSIEHCLQRRIVTWPNDSIEHKQRTTSVVDMLISTGYPVTLVDQPSFKAMTKTLDSKYAVPGLFRY